MPSESNCLVTERADVVDDEAVGDTSSPGGTSGDPHTLAATWCWDSTRTDFTSPPPPATTATATGMIDLTAPQRQSPLAIVFLGLRIFRSLGIAQLVILVLFIVRAPFDGPLIVLPFVIIVAFGGFSVLAWWRYTFQLVDGELVVTKGVVRVVRLNVPIERIQSIAIEQQLLHRLTGLVRVTVDTAGSREAEFSIDAIARPVAEELQRQAVTAVPAPTPIDGQAATTGACRGPGGLHPRRTPAPPDGTDDVAAHRSARPRPTLGARR